TIQDPSAGPTAAASAPTAPQMLTAIARFSRGNAASTSASDAGSSIAAPTPCSTRDPTSIVGNCASAHSADDAVKIAAPHRNTRLRPTRSATRPAVTSSAPNTIVYALRTHERSAFEAVANVSRISGNATYRIVVSSETANTARLVSASTRHGLAGAP